MSKKELIKQVAFICGKVSSFDAVSHFYTITLFYCTISADKHSVLLFCAQSSSRNKRQKVSLHLQLQRNLCRWRQSDEVFGIL